MKTIYAGSGEGKTRAAIKIANETGAYLVVRSAKIAQELAHLTARFPITYKELIQTQMRGSYTRNIVIDDADRFIEYVASGLRVEAITINKETPVIRERALPAELDPNCGA